jgi:hypothetical protein
MGEDGEDDGRLKPLKMSSQDAEYYQHPYSGAFIRNPLREKARSQPILLSGNDFKHNCLDDTLGEWHCVSVSESSFRDMMNHWADTHGGTMSPSWSRKALDQTRCSLGRVHSLTGGFEFVVQLRKSTYVAPRKKPPRPGDRKDASGYTIDKLNMEVSDVDGRSLRIDNITEGLVLAWNRANVLSGFQVKIGDVITKVNDRKLNSAAMIEEMKECSDLVRMTVQRTPSFAQRSISKTLAGENTMLPGPHGEFSAGSLAKPDGQKRRPSLTH